MYMNIFLRILVAFFNPLQDHFVLVPRHKIPDYFLSQILLLSYSWSERGAILSYLAAGEFKCI